MENEVTFSGLIPLPAWAAGYAEALAALAVGASKRVQLPTEVALRNGRSVVVDKRLIADARSLLKEVDPQAWGDDGRFEVGAEIEAGPSGLYIASEPGGGNLIAVATIVELSLRRFGVRGAVSIEWTDGFGRGVVMIGKDGARWTAAAA